MTRAPPERPSHVPKFHALSHERNLCPLDSQYLEDIYHLWKEQRPETTQTDLEAPLPTPRWLRSDEGASRNHPSRFRGSAALRTSINKPPAGCGFCSTLRAWNFPYRAAVGLAVHSALQEVGKLVRAAGDHRRLTGDVEVPVVPLQVGPVQDVAGVVG